MKTQPQSVCGAFTLTEVLVVIAVIAILAILVVPIMGSHHGRGGARSAQCLNNLRQVVLAEIMWSSAHGDKFSAQLSTNAGGSLEWLAAGQLNLHYQNLR